VDQGLECDAAPDVERADALGRIELVTAMVSRSTLSASIRVGILPGDWAASV
jgi:hypothetical protein